MTPWADLDANTQIQLRQAYADDPAFPAGICSLEAKTAHFAAWLAERGVRFDADDLKRR